MRPRPARPYVGRLGASPTRAACTSRRSRRWPRATSTSPRSGWATGGNRGLGAVGPRNVRMRAGELGVDVQGDERRCWRGSRSCENQGYQFEAAEGSFELLVRRSQPGYVPPFEVLDVVVIAERRRGRDEMFAEATVKLKVGGPGRPRGGGGRRPRARARRRLAQGARAAPPEPARRAPGRLQGPHPRPRVGDRRQDARAHRGGPRTRSAGAPSASPRTSSRPARTRWRTAWSCTCCGRATGRRRASRPVAAAAVAGPGGT